MNILSRRDFIGGAAAAFGGLVLPADAFGTGGKPLLKLGVISDIHIGFGGIGPSKDLFLKELRWLDSQGVEAVIFPGDMADHGLISELEALADVWQTVFPNGCASDGRKVERLVVSGNHELALWEWSGWSEERLAKEKFYHGDNTKRVWKRLFDAEWDLVWKREVKGVTFIGSQFSSLNPPIEKFMKDHAHEIDPKMPFVYFQHAHPLGTCHGEFARDEGGCDNGVSTRALSAFPNAIAFSGHSHLPLTDDRAVWQGAFTSIGAGAAGMQCPTAYGQRRWNGGSYYYPRERRKLSPPLLTCQNGRGGLFVEIFQDHLIVHRQSFFYDEPLGKDWAVPLPAAVDGPYDFKRRKATVRPPEFPKGAKIRLEYLAKAPESAGSDFRGVKPCLRVSFDCASEGGSRVFDYEVREVRSDGTEKVKEVFSPGFHFPPTKANVPGEVLLPVEEYAGKSTIRYTVTPRNCFGTAGKSIASRQFRVTISESCNEVV